MRSTRPRLARWSPAGDLLALVATAPVVDPEVPAEDVQPVEPVEQQAPPPAERTPVDQQFEAPAGGVPFTIPAVVLEGWETSDGRYIEPGAIGRRDLPMSLMAMLRNPDGGWGHDAAIVCGRIDTLERVDWSAELNRETGEPYGPDVWAWRATGYLVPHEDQPGSRAAVDYIGDGVLRGLSVDLGEVAAEEDVLEVDDEGWPERVRIRVTQASIAQATAAPFQAFPGCTIVLDDGQGAEAAGATPTEPAEPTGPAEDEAEPLPIAASALRLHYATGTGGRRLTLVAGAGIAPEQPPRAWFTRQEQPNPTRHVYLGRHPDGTPTGQVWGYVAEWGVPHAGILDREVVAPRLGAEGYRTFTSQGATLTAEGDEVPTGVLTFGGGHASTDLGVVPALAHYDNAGSAYADVVMGEDEVGVWFAGAMRPNLSREQVEQFARHPLSGDWRANSGDSHLRFVAALSVNTPGFPIGTRRAIAASGVRSLVAAGSLPLARRAQRERQGGVDDDRLRRAIDERMRPVLTHAARAQLARLRRRP